MSCFGCSTTLTLGVHLRKYQVGDYSSSVILFYLLCALNIFHSITFCRHLRVPSLYPALNIINQYPSLEQHSYVLSHFSIFTNQNNLKLATNLSVILNPQKTIFSIISATRNTTNQSKNPIPSTKSRRAIYIITQFISFSKNYSNTSLPQNS